MPTLKPCTCGCGVRTQGAYTQRCRGKHEHGHRWRGGRARLNGYVQIKRPDHHRADAHGYVLEHILVAEEMLGRPIGQHEHVHHRNGIKNDNRPENLQVLPHVEHHRHHFLRYRKAVLIEALRWKALRAGHTPAQRDLYCEHLRSGDRVYRVRFGSYGAAARAAGLVPNAPRTRRREPLPAGFIEQHGSLLRFNSLPELFDGMFGGILTDHEREQLAQAEAAQHPREDFRDNGEFAESVYAGVGHRGTTAAEVEE